MISKTEIEYKNTLKELVMSSIPLMEILMTVRSIIPDAYIGAGVIRNYIWNCFHNFDTDFSVMDIDIVYYDLYEDYKTKEAQYLQSLLNKYPNYKWDITNQAKVHLWYKDYFGVPLQQLSSLENAIGIWPEIATCVAVSLDHKNNLSILAPHGLSDLFNMVVRWNSTFITYEQYLQRVNSKRFEQKWPLTKVVKEI